MDGVLSSWEKPSALTDLFIIEKKEKTELAEA